MIISLGTRSSKLALAQAESVKDQLENEELTIKIQTMESLGDAMSDREIPEIGETGVFTSKLNRAVLEGTVDIAVHSLKDLPTEIEEGLMEAAIPPRTTPMDTLIGLDEPDLNNLSPGIVIGTSSIRRRANLLYRNDSISVKPCRGNVPTRLQKLDDPDQPYDALILAMAGLERLEETPSPMRMIRPDEILPAPGQGAIGIVCRQDDRDTQQHLNKINHEPSQQLSRAERAFLNEVEGGCQAPVGAIGKLSQNELVLEGSVTDPDGRDQVQGEHRGPLSKAETIGRELAQQLINDGAGEFIVDE